MQRYRCLSVPCSSLPQRARHNLESCSLRMSTACEYRKVFSRGWWRKACCLSPPSRRTFSTTHGTSCPTAARRSRKTTAAGSMSRTASRFPVLAEARARCASMPREASPRHIESCDPTGVASARKCPALGAFKHEAVAVDPVYRHLYLTEDESDGRLYRFSPTKSVQPGRRPALLLVATRPVRRRTVAWHHVRSARPVSGTPGLSTTHLDARTICSM